MSVSPAVPGRDPVNAKVPSAPVPGLPGRVVALGGGTVADMGRDGVPGRSLVGRMNNWLIIGLLLVGRS